MPRESPENPSFEALLDYRVQQLEKENKELRDDIEKDHLVLFGDGTKERPGLISRHNHLEESHGSLKRRLRWWGGALIGLLTTLAGVVVGNMFNIFGG